MTTATAGSAGGRNEGTAPVAVERALALLGLPPQETVGLNLLKESPDRSVYRIRSSRGDFVVKRWLGSGTNPEVQAYRLLRDRGVPVLGVLGETDDCLLIEDLCTSPSWRLAQPEDLDRTETAEAIAEWYVTFHGVGREAVKNRVPPFLRPEVDELTPTNVCALSEGLGVGDHCIWSYAADQLTPLKAFYDCLPHTLTYNDFHWTNLAVIRSTAPDQAKLFDFHLLGYGLAAADWDNVRSGLPPRARRAFVESYGPVDFREVLAHRPLATLHAILVATQRPSMPEWAGLCVREAVNGQLERQIREALEMGL